MNKQDIIREGIIQITKSRPMAYQLLRFLHDNNVVIRVEQVLPDRSYFNEENRGYELELSGHTQVDMIKAGYVAAESLIEETDGVSDY